MGSPGLVRTTRAGLAILERAGFDREEAASAWRTLLSYTFGFGLAETSDSPEEEFDRGLARVLAGLSAA